MKFRMYLLMCLVLFALSVANAATVQGVVPSPTGQPLKGRVTITWEAFGSYPKGQIVVPIADSRFTVNLTANKDSGVLYKAAFFVGAGVTWTEYWSIPSSPATVTLDMIRTGQPNTPPPSGVDIYFAQIKGQLVPGQLPPISYSADFNVAEYKTGTVNVTEGDTHVVGTETTFTSSMDNWWIILDGCSSTAYRIRYVSESAIDLYDPAGCTVTNGTFTLLQPVKILGSQHQLGSSSITAQCFDNSTPGKLLEPLTIFRNRSTYDLEVIFWKAQAGSCTVHL
jgi:hypothetical protein